MSLSTPFIDRPVATTLMTIAITLSGILGYGMLPVSSLPQVDYPSIGVNASLPGASPETMASAVATPLERQFGRIAGISEMTSASSLGSTSITMQFDLNRDINAAAREFGITYSQFANGLRKAAIDIDRKMLADLAVHDKAAFGHIVEKVKAQLAA